MSIADPVHLPLADVRVVEISNGARAGCGRILADLGADVVLVEPPEGAPERRAEPSVGGVGATFFALNANKRAIRLDWTTDAGRDELLQLLDRADIFLETLRPGTLAAAGLSAGSLRERNPRLVVTSITDFGQTGPYRDWLGNDGVHLALSSVLSRSGLPGRPPLMPPGELASAHASAQAAWVTLVALFAGRGSGIGDHVDVSVLEATTGTMDPAYGMAGTAAAGARASSQPSGRPDGSYMYPIFTCADGVVRICVLAARQWEAMFVWLGQPAEFADPQYRTVHKRFAARERLYPLIGALFANRTVAELLDDGQRRGVPLEAVNDATQVLHNEQFAARGAFVGVTLPDGTSAMMPHGMLEIDGRRLGFRHPMTDGDGSEGFRPRDEGAIAAAVSPPTGLGPLSGLRVLDLGVIVVGAETSRLFADLGADVIKIESSAFPDGSRQSSPAGTVGATFAYGHRSKRSLGMSLRDPRGKQLFLELVAQSDIVLSNFKPGTMDSLGIGAEVLSEANPRIVSVESSALGPTGPASRRMGYGPLVRAVTGLTGLWRYPDPPGSYCDSVTVYPDHTAARIGAIGALAAVMAARRTGTAQAVSVAQAEVMLSQFSAEFLRESVRPGSLHAFGAAGEHDAPYGIYPCAGDDQWCVVAIQGVDQWRALCNVIGAPMLAMASVLNTAADRIARRAEIDEAVRAWTSGYSSRDVMHLLQQAGVPAGAMLRVAELPDDPHLRARQFFAPLPQPQFDDLITDRAPAVFQRLEVPALSPAPLQGQHTREIVGELLGLNASDIDTLVASGILEEPAAATTG